MKSSSTLKLSLASFVVILAFGGVAAANEDPKVAAEVIAITKTQWAAEAAGRPVPDQMSIAADDYTEFNGDFAVRVDTKAVNVKFGELALKDGGKQLASEMANAKVQVYGDTAILSYTFLGVSQAKDGKIKNRTSKSTRVYTKVGGAWKLVHAHFSPIVMPKD
ncbi:MAG: nuclear transport factor 2 family protein [Deltaproteobacteria bacterium]